MDICTGLDACEVEAVSKPATGRVSGDASETTIDGREFERLYRLYLECLCVRSRGLQQWNRLPEAMRLAVTELTSLYRDDVEVLRAVDFDGDAFISNRKGAGL